MEKITLLLVDDHRLVRETWALMLNADPRFQVLDHCGTAEEAFELCKLFRPDVVIMDIKLPGMNGFEATAELFRLWPEIKVLTVSLHTQSTYVRKSLQAGAKGYVTKNSSKEELVKAIAEVHNGGRYICAEIKNILAEQELVGDGENNAVYNLSGREVDIIRLLKCGFSSKEIALSIGLHIKTVQVHRYNILQKLKMPNVAALVNYINHSQLAPEL